MISGILEKVDKMSNPESLRTSSGENNQTTRWDDLSVEVEFHQKTPELSTSINGTPEESRTEVLRSYSRASQETDRNGGEQESDFIRQVGEVDHYMMSVGENKEAMARYVADLAGVLSDVKPSALIQILPSELNLEPADLHAMLTGLKLEVASGWEKGQFFVSRDKGVAEQLKQGFLDLWESQTNDSTKKTEIDRRIGRLLGYPDTAINQDFSGTRNLSLIDKIKGAFKKRQDETLDRHYTHSLEHANEEFEQYEKPIHAFLDRYCPEATKVLKNEKTSSGKTYKW